MKLNYFRRIAASILAGLLIFALPGAGAAESLAGKVGDKRFSPYLPGNPKDECTKTYHDYVAAGGHSAYATTFYSRVVDLYIICGSGLNAPSQKAAEERALRSCQAGLKKWKVRTASGGCEIAASK
ncbi:MAG: hypothetical protein EOS65_20620 [Mesorhizobium sp.]|uniref:hypothetical protein n=1 Tax=unclassified Mesorhizobium TaxID=325217 RepID=UPI000FD52531|nr:MULTISPECIES: hypothetical protein [unclassified Mesorhizobium]RVC61681.1 hypothetical protein EN779_09930 [Mesorhizobium sp. M4B.F.Ca.ET.088.02.2.1]RWF33053.1 MAG: hypothetical protein EOS45_04565 [Mesorhizobium sp.]RWF39135.1 MAG: hypothetical protein EOS65_20620 [Mesorhizobium sp.]RWX66365.1 hypothetical protein EN780_15350 [Mesorhizobium sp. M4B.F.Ca.ET.089.01.1.1]TIX12606.1 MAG: hypothetical protein E5V41_23555 [Mesorhizobium sp.]